jgi:hypothetical protein
VYVPKSVTTIADNAFAGFSNIYEIEFESGI